MTTLKRHARRQLERTVIEARNVAEAACEKALESLAIGEREAHASMTREQKGLRNRLRAHGRQLGDQRNAEKGTQEIDHLVAECAYEHWHRMLFARFLAENDLLLEPTHGVWVSIAEVQDLARELGQDWVALASEYAVKMLPEVFRQDDPVLEVMLAPEDRKALEELLESLTVEVFTADDSLGWTYQFWQSERKDQVNESGEKVGADELAPVTQLFTEDYMVEFLLHNTLGAWWVGREFPGGIEADTEAEARAKASLPDVEWTYLRLMKDEQTAGWRPAAGTFEGWPKAARNVTVLDPCMGSGHFLVFALPMLVAFRMAEEGLAKADSVEAVLRDNLFGLELDARCTQIAAFNLALTAWRIAGYRCLPALHLACSGLAPNTRETDWQATAGDSQKLQNGMERLFRLFKDAPVLGSLIDPRASESNLLEAGFQELEPLLERALAQEAKDDTAHELAVTAHGLSKAAEVLAGQFTLVATNVPYLGRGKHDAILRKFCDRYHRAAKADLATCFVDRCVRFALASGATALVSPQGWWFQQSSKDLRAAILTTQAERLIATLGEEAWQSFGDRGPVAVLMILENRAAVRGHVLFGLEALPRKSILEKMIELQDGQLIPLTQSGHFENPDHRITTHEGCRGPLLQAFADSYLGLGTCDAPHYTRGFWELSQLGKSWSCLQAGPSGQSAGSGREQVVAWDRESRRVLGMSDEERRQGHNQDHRGSSAWGRKGIAVSLMRTLRATAYDGDLFEKSMAVLVPKTEDVLLAVKAFTESPEFSGAVRRLDKKVMVTNATLVKVPFDLARWQKVAEEKYPDGLPRPRCDDPTQWLFDGRPSYSNQPLQVAVARLLGYRWPRQTGSKFLEAPDIGPDGIEPHADADGIVCLASLKGEEAAEVRLRRLLAAAYGKEWSASRQADLLAQVGCAGRLLEDWLREGFFAQHCVLFHQHPFIWHVWDGLSDGFHALVNYHKLAAPAGEGRRTLEKLTFSYLGDWIARQRADVNAGREGADAKLAAARHLQEELKRILAGEPPYDIFVRWRPFHEQPIGWEPDVNDGVRLNLRPFMTAPPLGVRGQKICILRSTPRIKWDKDRGKEPERPKSDYPWFWAWDEETEDFKGGREFDGNRWNDLHYSIEAKQAARERHAATKKGR